MVFFFVKSNENTYTKGSFLELTGLYA